MKIRSRSDETYQTNMFQLQSFYTPTVFDLLVKITKTLKCVIYEP